MHSSCLLKRLNEGTIEHAIMASMNTIEFARFDCKCVFACSLVLTPYLCSLTFIEILLVLACNSQCPQVCGWHRMGPKSRELAKFSPCTNHLRQQAAHLLVVHVAIILSPPATTVVCTPPVRECVRRCAAGVEWFLNRENSPCSHHARTI